MTSPRTNLKNAGVGIVIQTAGETIGGQNTFTLPNTSSGALTLSLLTGNVIGYNGSAGISINGGSIGSGNTVLGNYVGVDPSNPKINLNNSVGIEISQSSAVT